VYFAMCYLQFPHTNLFVSIDLKLEPRKVQKRVVLVQLSGKEFVQFKERLCSWLYLKEELFNPFVFSDLCLFKINCVSLLTVSQLSRRE